MKKEIITVQNIEISISKEQQDDYICITDIAKAKNDNSRAADIIRNWLRNRTTLEFLSTWESFYNPNFKVFESEHFKQQSGLLTFTPKLYLIKEFQRLKEQENIEEQLEWNAKRFLSKNNYLIQTDAVKQYLIPSMNYKENLEWLVYAEEADILNVALFGFTAKAWRDVNPELAKKGNVRDYATIHELTVLSNLETHNAQMIREGIRKQERFQKLKEIAEYQLEILNSSQKYLMTNFKANQPKIPS